MLTALGVIVVLAVVGGLVVVLQGVGGTGDRTSSSATGRHPASATPRPSPISAANVNRPAVESCHKLWSMEQRELNVAGPAMSQWQGHIAAMNQLVAGKITLSQALAFWGRTRVRAASHVRAFDRVDRRFLSTTRSLCPGTKSSRAEAAPGGACLDAAKAAGATVVAARVTMATWRNHLQNMERLRSGMLSPTMAQQMWLHTWRKGVQELHSYHRHLDKAKHLRCPS